jgi:uncharacterized membrane protein YtjA (UPF0391 family)
VAGPRTFSMGRHRDGSVLMVPPWCADPGPGWRAFISRTRPGPNLPQEAKMLKYAIIFAVISLIAGALGFGGVAAGAAGIAKILFGLFLILAVVFLILAALGVGAARKALK